MKEDHRKSYAAALMPGVRVAAPKRVVFGDGPTGSKQIDTSVAIEQHDQPTVAVSASGVPVHKNGATRQGRSSHRSQTTAWRPRNVQRLRARRAISAILGVALVGGGACAATSWIVGLNSESSAEGQAASIQNLTITAVSSPAPTNQLFPGGTGDVVLTISNPNPYPVTVTGVDLPTNTTYAGGFTTNALSQPRPAAPRPRAWSRGPSPPVPRAAPTPSPPPSRSVPTATRTTH